MGLMGDDSVFALPIFLIALLLEIVVVVNEFGHWLAMRWFGHRDATMTLIPFFGGAAIGGQAVGNRLREIDDRADGAAFSALVILLLAIPLKFWYADSPLHGSHAVSDLPTICKFLVGAVAAAFVLIATPLNLFNLVPVSMFDGARAVDALRKAAWAVRWPGSRYSGVDVGDMGPGRLAPTLPRFPARWRWSWCWELWGATRQHRRLRSQCSRASARSSPRHWR